jgi:TonB family protein
MRVLIALLALLLCHAALADDLAQNEDFKAAWAAYSAAVESGRGSRILKTSKTVADLAEQLLPESDPRLAKILQNYGVALRRGMKKTESRKVLERSLDLMENIHGKGSIELVPVMSDLADAYSRYSSSDRQLSHYKRAIKIVRKAHGKDSMEYADLAFRAATNTFSFSRSLAARQYLLDAQRIYTEALGNNDQKVGLTDFFLGKMAFAENSYRRATDYLEAALQSFAGESDEAREYRQATHALLVQVHETFGRSDLATRHSMAIGMESPSGPDKDYQPLFKQLPHYPRAMWQRRIEGYVNIEFTVNEEGFTENARVIKVVTSDPDRTKKALASDDENKSFAAAALAVVKKFRYAPRFENGVAVPVENVKYRVVFKLGK